MILRTMKKFFLRDSSVPVNTLQIIINITLI